MSKRKIKKQKQRKRVLCRLFEVTRAARSNLRLEKKVNDSESSKKIREALGTQQPRLHHIPRWMLRRLVKAFPSQCRTQDEAKQKIFHLASGFLDHFGTIKRDGKLIFVCEPYGPSSGQLMLAEAFAEVLQIRCSAEPESWWYPGKTYRISFWEAEDA